MIEFGQIKCRPIWLNAIDSLTLRREFLDEEVSGLPDNSLQLVSGRIIEWHGLAAHLSEDNSSVRRELGLQLLKAANNRLQFLSGI